MHRCFSQVSGRRKYKSKAGFCIKEGMINADGKCIVSWEELTGSPKFQEAVRTSRFKVMIREILLLGMVV